MTDLRFVPNDLHEKYQNISNEIKGLFARTLPMCSKTRTVAVSVTYLYVLNYVEERDEIQKLSVSVVVKPGTDRHRKVGVKYVGSRGVVDYNAVLNRPS